MRDCENTAEIDGSGKNVIGGIAGLLQATTNAESRIEKCRNSGNVYGKTSTGGIVGNTKCAVRNARNSDRKLREHRQCTDE